MKTSSSPAIGKGGQNVRLAARLTGWKIDIRSIAGDEGSSAPEKTTEEPEDAPEESLDETPKEESAEE